MKRALLISIHPEWAEKILKGEKTIEIRTWIPKDYVGWVYVYITLGELIERHWKKINPIDRQIILYGVGVKKSDLSSPHSLNGKVAFRFWYEKVDTIEIGDDGCVCLINGVQDDFPKGSCLTEEELCDYIGYGDDLSISSNFAKGYAWHIDKLEVFDKPKELSEFIHYRRETIYCGMDCPPYTDWVEYPIRKAPQKCAWVYIDEKPEPHQVSVLDEETPSKKDEKERKPF